mmetsp:Transcript_19916/g.57890  ORF Transcript_19916/g.57890 Transcript_19916/m.57890 type:complete len:269 (+) Transcript_19916:358-1164(+)
MTRFMGQLPNSCSTARLVPKRHLLCQEGHHINDGISMQSVRSVKKRRHLQQRLQQMGDPLEDLATSCSASWGISCSTRSFKSWPFVAVSPAPSWDTMEAMPRFGKRCCHCCVGPMSRTGILRVSQAMCGGSTRPTRPFGRAAQSMTLGCLATARALTTRRCRRRRSSGSYTTLGMCRLAITLGTIGSIIIQIWPRTSCSAGLASSRRRTTICATLAVKAPAKPRRCWNVLGCPSPDPAERLANLLRRSRKCIAAARNSVSGGRRALSS